MSAKEIFDRAAAQAIKTIGELARFTPRVGNPIENCSVNLVIASEPQPAGFESTVLEPETTIEYILKEVGKEADPGDIFTVAGVKYTVKELRENDGRTIKVVVKNED